MEFAKNMEYWLTNLHQDTAASFVTVIFKRSSYLASWFSSGLIFAEYFNLVPVNANGGPFSLCHKHVSGVSVESSPSHLRGYISVEITCL